MTGEKGGFYSAEDADSLPAQDARAKRRVPSTSGRRTRLRSRSRRTAWRSSPRTYGVEQDGNVSPDSDPHNELEGKNVFIRRLSLPEAAAHFQRSLPEMETRLKEGHRTCCWPGATCARVRISTTRFSPPGTG